MESDTPIFSIDLTLAIGLTLVTDLPFTLGMYTFCPHFLLLTRVESVIRVFPIDCHAIRAWEIDFLQVLNCLSWAGK